MIQRPVALQINGTQPKRDQGPLERILSIRQLLRHCVSTVHAAIKLGRVKAGRNCAEPQSTVQ